MECCWWTCVQDVAALEDDSSQQPDIMEVRRDGPLQTGPSLPTPRGGCGPRPSPVLWVRPKITIFLYLSYSSPPPQPTTSLPTIPLILLISVFSHKGIDLPAVNPHLLLLLLAGDIETNPGPDKFTCPKCNTTITNRHYSIKCNQCQDWLHLKCTTLTSYKLYNTNWTCGCSQITPQNPPTPPIPPQPPHNPTRPDIPSTTQTNNSPAPKHTLNILQLNINGISNKTHELKQHMKEYNIHIALIQETRLSPSATTPQFQNYTTIRQDRQHRQGGGLITLIHKDIPFTNTTQDTKQHIQDNTLEITSIKIKLHETSYNIVNTYIPPTASCPPRYTPQLQQITTLPNLFLCGDMNAHHPTWLSTQTQDLRGDLLIQQLHSLNILNLRNQPTRLPPNQNHHPTSPDITLCTPTLHTRTTWQTKHALSSDHIPIHITHQLLHPVHTTHKKTYTNYKRADWPAFTQHIESILQDFSLDSHQSLDHASAHINNTISHASKKHIPQGHRKHINPNFTPQIHTLIKQRNTLRQNHSPTQHDIDQIQTLNNTITDLITEQQKTNWTNYLNTVNHKTKSSKLWRTIKNIHTSRNTPPPTHEALLTQKNTIPTPKEHTNILMKHYAKISQKPTTRQNRAITKALHRTRTDPDANTPFTTTDTYETIKSLKNSHATGPDNISNIHLKHLGPIAIQALTSIFNHSWLKNKIPDKWKQAKIIPILKPSKPPNQPSSYRPISLLSTTSKVLERMMLKRINPNIPLSPSQHGFRPKHSTTTLHTNLTQHILDGFNQPKPPPRTLLAAIDISKAFDTVPRHLLTSKILNTTLHNNDKKWLANFIAGRQAHVSHNYATSKTHNLPNGVPQGAVLSPTLFNLFLHDIPPTPPTKNVHVLSYADDLTITSQNPNIQQATTNMQQYLTSLEQWLTQNRMSVSPPKSSITLLTPDLHESNLHPHITLLGQPLPLNKTPTILGITYDTHMTFTPHTKNINTKALRKLNTLRTVTGTNFGQQKETLSILYKQFIRTSLHYASPAWSPPPFQDQPTQTTNNPKQGPKNHHRMHPDHKQ